VRSGRVVPSIVSIPRHLGKEPVGTVRKAVAVLRIPSQPLLRRESAATAERTGDRNASFFSATFFGDAARAREPAAGRRVHDGRGRPSGPTMRKLAVSVWIVAAFYATVGVCGLAVLHARSPTTWRLPDGYGVTYGATAVSEIAK
jgi:hypothetical protein